MAMAETRRKFDRDFREGAVRLVRETGKPIAQVARDLGINEGTLGNWVNADKRRRGEGNGVLSEDARAGPGRPAEAPAQVHHAAGEGPVAGTGPGQAGLPGQPAQPEMVWRRHGDPHR